MQIRTYLDRPGLIPPDALVVCFGGQAPAQGRPLLLTDFGDADLARVQAVRPEDMKHGLVFLVHSQTYQAHKAAADRVQRHLAWLFCKFVHYPRFANIPDPCGLHGPKPPNIPNEINRNCNMPLLLRAPLTDSLARARLGLPLLLVLPGPSLNRLAPRLRHLSRVCLVACLSRTLGFCLEHGVAPDFLVQLDTAWRQAHLLPPGPALPGCTLVALSLAPVHDLAQRFRGVFFMDSFDLEVLPNPARLRESWLSSLLPCLGLAEALAAPLVLVAGADLSFEQETRYHGDATQPGASRRPFPGNRPPLVTQTPFAAPDLDGMSVTTTLPYFATAQEASLFARQIGAATGARFCNATSAGILDPQDFPPLDEAEIAALPAIDRAAVLAAVDQALARPEPVQLTRLKVKLLQTANMVRENLDFLNFCRWRKQDAEAAAHPVVAGLPRLGDYLARAGELDPGERLDLALRLMEEWQASLDTARNACLLEQERGRRGRVSVLCLEGEEVLDLAAGRHPGIRPRPVRLWADTTPPPADGDWLEYAGFAAWSLEQKVFLVTPQAAGRLARLLRAMPRRNWVSL